MEKERIKQLEQTLERWNKEYWEGHPSVSDSQYDKTVEELRSLDPGSSFCDFLGTPIVCSSGKVTHDKPMLSLDKAYDIKDFLAWAGKSCRTNHEKLYIMPKYDGISADWDGSVLSTRGDGHVGENITDKISLIMLLRIDESTGEWYGQPLTECKDNVRGEIVMLDQDFENIKDKFKNSRNAVAGALGAIYNVEWAMSMRSIGFRMVLIPHNEYRVEATVQQFQDHYEEIIDTCKKAIAVPMDGVVLTIADSEYGKSLGATAHHPRHSIAYKFANEEATTKLIGVEWSVGLNKVTPVAILDPVELAGVTVSRASLHNLKYIQDMDLQIGDIVTVERAGAVIPNVISRIPGMDRTMITCNVCPVCGTTLMFDGTALTCVNENCTGKLVTDITTAAATLGIDNLSTMTVKKMVDAGVIHTVSDLYKLTEDKVLTVDGFAQKSAFNLVCNIKKTVNTKDYLVLAALNIPGVGIEMSKNILKEVTLNELPFVGIDLLRSIQGVGDVRAKTIVDWVSKNGPKMYALMDAVKYKNTKDDPKETKKPVIVFTGAMPKPRSYYKDLAESNGYIFKDSITKETTVLVVSEAGHKSTKVTKAEKNGCKIITLDEFLKEVEK